LSGFSPSSARARSIHFSRKSSIVRRTFAHNCRHWVQTPPTACRDRSSVRDTQSDRRKLTYFHSGSELHGRAPPQAKAAPLKEAKTVDAFGVEALPAGLCSTAVQSPIAPLTTSLAGALYTARCTSLRGIDAPPRIRSAAGTISLRGDRIEHPHPGIVQRRATSSPIFGTPHRFGLARCFARLPLSSTAIPIPACVRWGDCSKLTIRRGVVTDSAFSRPKVGPREQRRSNIVADVYQTLSSRF